MATPNEQLKQQVVGLSKEDLLEILRVARTPVKTEKELRDEHQAKIDREAMMETLKTAEANRQKAQADCRHFRPNGSTQTVYIENLHRLYCQGCGKWIFASDLLDENGKVLAKAEPDLFNTHFQLAI